MVESVLTYVHGECVLHCGLFYASGQRPPCKWCRRHYVFGLSVRLCVRARFWHSRPTCRRLLVTFSGSGAGVSSWGCFGRRRGGTFWPYPRQPGGRRTSLWLVVLRLSGTMSDCRDVEDCGAAAVVMRRGAAVSAADHPGGGGGGSLADASALVRWCFGHNVGAVKQLVTRRRTDLDAAVSHRSISLCLSVSLYLVVVVVCSRRWYRRASTATRTKCARFSTRRKTSTTR